MMKMGSVFDSSRCSACDGDNFLGDGVCVVDGVNNVVRICIPCYKDVDAMDFEDMVEEDLAELGLEFCGKCSREECKWKPLELLGK